MQTAKKSSPTAEKNAAPQAAAPSPVSDAAQNGVRPVSAASARRSGPDGPGGALYARFGGDSLSRCHIASAAVSAATLIVMTGVPPSR